MQDVTRGSLYQIIATSSYCPTWPGQWRVLSFCHPLCSDGAVNSFSVSDTEFSIRLLSGTSSFSNDTVRFTRFFVYNGDHISYFFLGELKFNK